MAQTYTYDKQQVIDTLKENRTKHHAIFLEALEGYRKTAIAEFESNLEKVKKGRLVSYVQLKLPVDQTKDYDRVIAMFERSEGNKIELTEGQFTNYVLDDWDWKNQFFASNAMYSLTAQAAVESDDEYDD